MFKLKEKLTDLVDIDSNELKKLYDELKDSWLSHKKEEYKILKNNQEKDFWDRIIQLSEDLIYSHSVRDFEKFRLHWRSFLQESKLAAKIVIEHPFPSLFCKKFTLWVETRVFYQGRYSISYFNSEDFLKQLEKLYSNYQDQTPGFLEGVQKLKPIRQQLKNEITIKKNNKRINTQSSVIPKEIWSIIATHLTNIKDILNFESVNFLFQSLTQDTWKNILAQELMTPNFSLENGLFRQSFFSNYGLDISDPKIKYSYIKSQIACQKNLNKHLKTNINIKEDDDNKLRGEFCSKLGCNS